MAKVNERYVPILKTKEGERWSLSGLHIPTKQHVMPLLEMIPIPKPRKSKRTGITKPPISLTDHVNNQCDHLVAAWGTEQPFYLDTRWLHGRHGDPVVTSLVFDTARARNLLAIPVAYPGLTVAAMAEIAAVAALDGRGCMVRIERKFLDKPAAIEAAATATALPIKNLDLLLDYRGSPMSLDTDIPRIPKLSEWRELISASGIFPSSLQFLAQKTWTKIDRKCWTGWKAAIDSGKLPRTALFSDYTIRDPGPPAGGGNPPVALRYTAEDYWLAQIDGTLHGTNAPNMINMCKQLIARPEYLKCGSAYSRGDGEISRIAAETFGDPNAETGGAAEWVRWAISHHIEFVVKDQILRMP